MSAAETTLPKLAVNRRELCHLLGLDDGRSASAMYQSAKRFLDRHRIEKLPGGVYPLRKIEKALQ
jgi:hypothetical protein